MDKCGISICIFFTGFAICVFSLVYHELFFLGTPLLIGGIMLVTKYCFNEQLFRKIKDLQDLNKESEGDPK